ncbi:MAG: hypothetical protein ACLUGV_02425 [Alistipes shahii]
MKHMKHLFIALAAGFAATFAAAQIPMPAWELSEAVERQSGVMNYTNEKFDFRRLPMHRSISEFLHPGDTVQYRTFLFDVTVCDAGGPVSQLRFQSDPQVVRKEADTVTFVAADNAWLQVVALAHLPLDASDELVRHAVDSLKDIRTITDGMDILPAKQCGMSYALQYLSAGRESTRNRCCLGKPTCRATRLPSCSAIAANLSGRCVSAGILSVLPARLNFRTSISTCWRETGSGRCRSPFSAATVNFGRKSAPVSIFRSIRSSPSGATIRRRRMSAYTG